MKKNKIKTLFLLGTLSMCQAYGSGNVRLDYLEKRIEALENKLGINSVPSREVSPDKYSPLNHGREMLLDPLTQWEIENVTVDNLDAYISKNLKEFSPNSKLEGVLEPKRSVDAVSHPESAIEISALYHVIHFPYDMKPIPGYETVGEGKVVYDSYNISFGKFARSLKAFVKKNSQYLNKPLIDKRAGFNTIADILTTYNALIAFINELYDHAKK